MNVTKILRYSIVFLSLIAMPFLKIIRFEAALINILPMRRV